ncbi:MAG TPA: 4a-hydroxytetrahydrobiopterin dehydratase [Ignavibacteria bacterium]|nr:4a-hydroxytetrahydrobiopterin dehydratase [Ignavibacteria bacterium]HMQ98845.1 4a-hydroxytetrahydrobiopterin dehydratase [Ignavibacteria bacterium]
MKSAFNMEKLSEQQITDALKTLPGWYFSDGSIKKIFKTVSFPATMGFVAAAGGFCQRRNHHPDYILMKFREIEVSFSTHSAGGITQKDIEIASDLEKIPL